MMTRQSPALGTGLPVIQGEAQTVNQHSLCGGTATHVTHSLDSYAPAGPRAPPAPGCGAQPLIERLGETKVIIE